VNKINMRPEYDVIVVGAGPGGSWAARAAAEKGARVLLLEKDREVGVPVRCAEAVGELGLKSIVPNVRDRWIASIITGVVLISPSGKEVVAEGFKGRGYVLDRKIFDYELAQIAAERGVEVRTKAYVYDLIRDNGAVNGVRVQHLGKNYDVRAKIVIGADGVESRVGRWAGLRTNVKLRDMETCMQVTLTNIKADPRFIYLYFGEKVAPGGYFWVFPKGEGIANVGVGISGEHAKQRSAQQYLNDFVSRHYPSASALYTVVGGVPCSPTSKRITADGLMLVGDAAHQVNPMTGGGITTAMIAGQIAGRVAAAAIAAGDISEKNLATYPKEWHEAQGKTHERLYKIKQAVYKLTDADLDHTAEVVSALKPEERTLINIFKTALSRHPALIFDLLKVFLTS
jgi:digeranylgeranylglycerophospholipid reductase